ncbi:MAG TPA: A24 family peptidase [Candidatus Eisenbacteria bacterium]|nr:A24 family peptidase [Candidatus Eisenbacteria bacterium]
MQLTHWMAGGAVILCSVATWWDLRHRRIPNALTIPALVAALCVHGAVGAGQGLLLSACGAVVAGALVLPGYAFRSTGAGDVKLLMAVGAILTFPLALKAGLAALIAGGLIGLGVSVRDGRFRDTIRRTAALGRWLFGRAAGAPEPKPESSNRHIPFGVAIAVATLALVLVPQIGGSR